VFGVLIACCTLRVVVSAAFRLKIVDVHSSDCKQRLILIYDLIPGDLLIGTFRQMQW